MSHRLAVAAFLALLAVASSAPAAPVPLVCGDSNANGTVTSTDALSVLRKGVGQDATVLCCGDGIRSGNEECEGADLAGDNCVNRGYGGGSLRCSSACAIDESGCWKSRFEDLGDTVYDHETGLEWEKKDSEDGAADAKNPHDVDNLYVWGDADPPYGPIGDAYTDFLARLNGAEDGKCYAGTCDWRLPTVDEWMSLVVPPIACEHASFCLTFFPPALEPMKDDVYWSSTTNGDAPSEAFVMVIPDAVAKSDIKKESHFLRAVRMGLKKSS